MTRLSWLWILLALWAGLYAASFLLAHHTAPTGDSFLRGINRLMVFFQYQIAAGVAAMAVWWRGRSLARGSWQRWLSRVPVGMALALVLLVVGLILYANLQKPGQTDHVPDPDRPVTSAAKPVKPVDN